MPGDISQSACQTASAFEAACSPRNPAKGDGYSRARKVLEDAHVNLRLWAGNLGALQRAKDPRSLDFRLRHEPTVAERVQEILIELADLIQKFTVWKHDRSEETNVRTGDSATEAEELLVELLEEKTSPSKELSWLTVSITDSVRRLHKISFLIEKAVTRDRYAYAEAHHKVKFPEQYDLAHTRTKFASQTAEPWLIDRLAKAITSRRNFLKYAREHRQRLGVTSDPKPIYGSDEEKSGTDKQQQQHLFSPSAKSGDFPQPSLPQTTASTLARLDVYALGHVIDDDDRSHSTHATSSTDGSSLDRQKVARLEKFAAEGEAFQCPYCYTTQIFNSQVAWERHVFSDLRAYICTSKACGFLMFKRKQDWITHELENHRRRWHCQTCGQARFKSHDQLQRHMLEIHGQDVDSDAVNSLFSQISSEPLDLIDVRDCPLCDWEIVMREIKPQIAKTGPVRVPP